MKEEQLTILKEIQSIIIKKNKTFGVEYPNIVQTITRYLGGRPEDQDLIQLEKKLLITSIDDYLDLTIFKGSNLEDLISQYQEQKQLLKETMMMNTLYLRHVVASIFLQVCSRQFELNFPYAIISTYSILFACKEQISALESPKILQYMYWDLLQIELTVPAMKKIGRFLMGVVHYKKAQLLDLVVQIQDIINENPLADLSNLKFPSYEFEVNKDTLVLPQFIKDNEDFFSQPVPDENQIGFLIETSEQTLESSEQTLEEFITHIKKYSNKQKLLNDENYTCQILVKNFENRVYSTIRSVIDNLLSQDDHSIIYGRLNDTKTQTFEVSSKLKKEGFVLLLKHPVYIEKVEVLSKIYEIIIKEIKTEKIVKGYRVRRYEEFISLEFAIGKDVEDQKIIDHLHKNYTNHIANNATYKDLEFKILRLVD
ncbi:MAG: hypothetical protein ACXAD7_02055 [Candidatus Kariarchaeaceae archaeon]|jgi:hypothetical protein